MWWCSCIWKRRCAGGKQVGKRVQSSGEKIWVVAAAEAIGMVVFGAERKARCSPEHTTTQRLLGDRGGCRLPRRGGGKRRREAMRV